MSAISELVEVLTKHPQRDAIVQEALEATKDMRWVPNLGPQTEAYFCDADELLYGGEAGGGKTDLIIGLSLTAHQRSLILRRTNKEADKLPDRYEAILGTRAGYNSQKGTWRIDGRIIDIGGVQLENDKQKRKGIPHDLKAFDEVVDFTESQYLFICTWNRSTDPNQRCRIVATTNPPTKPEGMWVVKRWAAWLDPKHPNPAKSGELRWYTTIDGVDTEVDGRGPHIVDGKEVYAKSRTFIRARLDDNPDLAQTDYGATLDALPEELRVAYREGRFDVGLKDQPFQAIPTDWIRAAQERWTERAPAGVPQCAIGVDCSGGGSDPMMIAIRHDGWYDHLIEVPAKEIPIERLGRHSAGIIVSYRRDNSTVIVDMGGGYGGSTYETLRDNNVEAIPYKGAEGSVRRTKDGQLRFINKRSEIIWKFREALDPSQPGGSPIMLPPDPMLMADLASPTFWTTPNGLQIEPKEDVCKRLGRSTDRGDAVCMAWYAGPTYVTDGKQWAEGNTTRGKSRPSVVMGRSNRR